MRAGQVSLIGTFNPLNAENLAFKHLSEVFKNIGLNVPEVMAISRDGRCYLQQDLGDDSLYKLIQHEADMQYAGPELLGRFEQALTHLALFQLEAHKAINYKKLSFSGQRFDKKAMLDDLQYFRYCFLKLHPELNYHENRLLSDMERFARLCASAPSDFFMYRDFQSRNIMIFNNSNFYIDFQGGRRGALQYDVVSLLWQAMAGFSHQQRESFIAGYKQHLANLNPVAAGQFDTYLPLFVHLRQMQVLGAYGLRGLVQRKAHFLKSIPLAIRSMADNLNRYPLPAELKELKKTLHALASLESKYPLAETGKKQSLVVDIYSFSFLQGGIPADTSGHGGGFVFDCRALPNPGREERFRTLTGRHKAVAEYLSLSHEVHHFLSSAKKIIGQSVDEYIRRGFNNLSVGFGCTGGQHRSVYCAETITNELRNQYPHVQFRLRHNNIKI
jgi:aminoglycoside/choline kinase family phosphotransferase